MQTRWIPLFTALAVTIASAGLADPPKEKKEDPKAGEISYKGSGYTERAPEFAEVWINFTVGKKASAEEVITALEAASGPVWRAIAEHIKGQETETTAAYWGDVSNIYEQEGSTLRVVNPTEGANARAGSAKRIDNRTGKEINLDEKRPPIFSGAQRIGFRTADMGFLEGLVRKVNEIEAGEDTDAVKTTVSGLSYKVTTATKRAMLAEVQEQAQRQATGPTSSFATDSRNFGFTSAHFIDATAGYPSRYEPNIGPASALGQRPKVTLTLPFTFVFYGEGKDLIKAKGTTEPVSLTYEVPGTATVDADYGTISVTIHSGYHKKKETAAAAVTNAAASVLERLRTVHGDKAVSETDRVVDDENSTPTQTQPWQPVAWNGTTVTRYQNTVTLETIDAPAEGTGKLPTLWEASKTLQLRSSDFGSLGALRTKLARELGRARAKVTEVKITVSDVGAAATEATKQRVATMARASATACVADPKGPVATDAALHGFKCAHLKEIQEGQPVPDGAGLGGGTRAMKSAAFATASAESVHVQSDALDVTPVVKNNDERPTFPMLRHFTFRYRVVSQNLVKGCKEAVATVGEEGA